MTTYAKFRETGMRAQEAFRAAKILSKWGEHENKRVRIYMEPELESYFDVFGVPDSEREAKEIQETIENLGCWWITSEVYCPACKEWEHSDSIGMCVYENPLDPLENFYIVELMCSALDDLTKVHCFAGIHP